MDATKFPDITTMTLDEAKQYILRNVRSDIEAHDVVIDALARPLLEAANTRREASEHLRGSRTQYFYGSLGNSPDAKFTGVLYDAAWELVQEGLLRPGPKHFEVSNQDKSGFV